MNRRTPLTCAALCALAVALGGRSLSAQTTRTVVGSAAVSATQGATTLTATLGQPAVGPVAGSALQASQGFWSARTLPPAEEAAAGEMLLSLTAAPNPLSRSTTLTFSVPEGGRVSLMLYNAVGKQVRTILDEEMAAGTAAREADLSGLSSGVYRAVLRTGERNASATLLLVE